MWTAAAIRRQKTSWLMNAAFLLHGSAHLFVVLPGHVHCFWHIRHARLTKNRLVPIHWIRIAETRTPQKSMLWLLLIAGVLVAGVAFPRLGKVITRLFALLVALVILVPLALIVTFQRMRLKRRRRNAAKARAKDSADRDESPRLGRVGHVARGL